MKNDAMNWGLWLEVANIKPGTSLTETINDIEHSTADWEGIELFPSNGKDSYVSKTNFICTEGFWHVEETLTCFQNPTLSISKLKLNLFYGMEGAGSIQTFLLFALLQKI